MDAFYFETNGFFATIAMGKKYVEIVATNRYDRWTKVMRVESKKFKDAKAVWVELITHNGIVAWDVIKCYDFSNKPKRTEEKA